MSVSAEAAVHDMALYDAMRALAVAQTPDIRDGRMFGAPAVYIGRRMAACVLGAEVGLRVPADIAAAACRSGRARPFTPYGKRPMREGIALDMAPDKLADASDLVAAAICFARANNAG